MQNSSLEVMADSIPVPQGGDDVLGQLSTLLLEALKGGVSRSIDTSLQEIYQVFREKTWKKSSGVALLQTWSGCASTLELDLEPEVSNEVDNNPQKRYDGMVARCDCKNYSCMGVLPVFSLTYEPRRRPLMSLITAFYKSRVVPLLLQACARALHILRSLAQLCSNCGSPTFSDWTQLDVASVVGRVMACMRCHTQSITVQTAGCALLSRLAGCTACNIASPSDLLAAMNTAGIVTALAEVIRALPAQSAEPAAIVCATEALAALKHIANADSSNIDLILAAGGLNLVRVAQNVAKGHGTTNQHVLCLLTHIACHPMSSSQDCIRAALSVLELGELGGNVDGMPGVLWGMSIVLPALMARTDLDLSAMKAFVVQGIGAAMVCLHSDPKAVWAQPGSLNVVESLSTVLGVLWIITKCCGTIDDPVARDNVLKTTAVGVTSLLDVFRARKGMELMDATLMGKAASGLIHALACMGALGSSTIPLQQVQLALTTALGVLSFQRRLAGDESSEWDETLVGWSAIATAVRLTVEGLVKAGPAVLNADDAEGRNLVHHLAACGQSRCLEIVLEVADGSIDFLARTKNGETALQLARMGRHTAAAALLEDVTQCAAEARQTALLEELEAAEAMSAADEAARKSRKKKGITRSPSFAAEQPDEKAQKIFAADIDIDTTISSGAAAAEQARVEIRQRLEEEYERALELRRIELAQQSAIGMVADDAVTTASLVPGEESSLIFTPEESQSPADRPTTPRTLLEAIGGVGAGSSGGSGSGSGLEEDPILMRLDSDGMGSIDVATHSTTGTGTGAAPLHREHSLFGSPSLTGDLFGGGGSLGSLGSGSSPSLPPLNPRNMMAHDGTAQLPDALFVHPGPIGLQDHHSLSPGASPAALPSASLLASFGQGSTRSLSQPLLQTHMMSPMVSLVGGASLRHSLHHGLGSPTTDGGISLGSSDGDSDASSEPTRHLWIGNLGTRTPRAVLKAVFEAHGVIEDVVTFPGRMYAFVNYCTVEEATAAAEALQNQVVPELTVDRPLLLKYRPVKKAAMHLRALGEGSTDGMEGINGVGGMGTARGDADGNCTDPSPRIWLGNIAPTATSKTLQAVLGRFGPLTDAAVFPARIGPLGYAFVKFEALEDAVRALETLNNTVVPPLSGSKQLKMRYKPAASGTSGRDDVAESSKASSTPSRHLWLGNITQKPSEDIVFQTFSKYGRVDSARVFPAKAYAFVNYADVGAAARAMTELDGVPIAALTGVKPLVMRFQQESQQPARPATSVAGLSIGALAGMTRTHSESALHLAASLNHIMPGGAAMGLGGLGSLAYRSDSFASDDAMGGVPQNMGGAANWVQKQGGVHRSASLNLLSSAAMSGMGGFHHGRAHGQSSRPAPLTSPFAPMMGIQDPPVHVQLHHHHHHNMPNQGTTTSASQLSAVLNNLAALQRAASTGLPSGPSQHDSITNLSNLLASQSLNSPEPPMPPAPTMRQNSWSTSLDGLLCPLSNQLMTDPVMAADGVTYNRPAILEWLTTQ